MPEQCRAGCAGGLRSHRGPRAKSRYGVCHGGGGALYVAGECGTSARPPSEVPNAREGLLNLHGAAREGAENSQISVVQQQRQRGSTTKTSYRCSATCRSTPPDPYSQGAAAAGRLTFSLWPKPGGLARNGRVPVGGASSANLQAPSQPDGSAQYYSQRTTIEPLTRGIPNV